MFNCWYLWNVGREKGSVDRKTLKVYNRWQERIFRIWNSRIYKEVLIKINQIIINIFNFIALPELVLSWSSNTHHIFSKEPPVQIPSCQWTATRMRNTWSDMSPIRCHKEHLPEGEMPDCWNCPMSGVNLFL